jgi:hypothetical protein
MKLTLRIFEALVFLAAIATVGVMAHTQLHKINRISEGRYEFVYYDVLGWHLSVGPYYAIAVVMSAIIIIGTISLWRIWRRQPHPKNLSSP